MTMQVRVSGWKEIIGAKVYSSGSWRTLVAIKGFVDGAWRDLATFATGPADPGDLIVAVSAASVNKVGPTSSMSSSNITATPHGGLAPYTYSWVHIGGSTQVTALSPTSATTAFRVTGLEEGETVLASFRVTVTDSLGDTDSEEVTAQFRRNIII